MITRLTDRIWVVEGGKSGRYPFAHSLYVADGGGILVDAGSDPEEIERLRTENGIAAVVMTHYHEDHFTFLSRLPDTPVWSSAADAPALESLETLLAWYGVLGNEWDGFYRKLFASDIPLRPEEGRAKDRGRGGTALRRHARGRRRRPRPYARAPVPAFPRRRGPVPRRLRPDGVRPVVRRRPVRHRLVPEVRPPPLRDRRGSIRGLPRGAGPPRPDRGEDARVPRRDRSAGGGAAGPFTGAAHPGGDHRPAPDLRPGRDGPWFDYGEWALLSKHLDAMLARGEAALRDGAYVLT